MYRQTIPEPQWVEPVHIDHQRRVPRKRAFAGLVGRPFDPSELTVEEIVVKHEISGRTVAEVRAIEERRKKGIFDAEKDFSDASVRFQKFVKDFGLKGTNLGDHEQNKNGYTKPSKKPKAESAAVGTYENINPITKTFGDLSLGAAGCRIDDGENLRPRRIIPWWIRDEITFDRFLRTLAEENGMNRQDCEKLTGFPLYEAVGLDWVILYDFYFLSREDPEIFDKNEVKFGREHDDSSRKRWTSSGNAVSSRRKRLVERGNQMFGSRSQIAEQGGDPWATIRTLPDLSEKLLSNVYSESYEKLQASENTKKSNFVLAAPKEGIGTSFIKCLAPQCQEVFITTKKVRPGAVFICRHHPRQLQTKLAMQNRGFVLNAHREGTGVETPSHEELEYV